MSRLQLAHLQMAHTRRVATVLALAAAGGSFGLLSAQAEADTAPVDDMTCVVLLSEDGATCPPAGEEPKEEEEGDHSYRVCHATGDPAHPWEEMVFESGGDQNDWLEKHPDDYELEDGKSCPPDPEQPPKEEEPPVVIVEQPQQQQQPAAVQQAAPAPQAQAAPSLNAPRACGSRRNFRIRVRTRKADPVVSAAVLVNGRRVRVVRGARLTAPVRLTGLPKGRYSVQIKAKTKSGRTLSGVRRYFTCTPKSARRTTPKL